MVSFVSSGPGDPELLTLRAVLRLQAADVVLYDDLASGPILEQAGPQTECIPVGKRAGRPSARQEHVNSLLIEHAQAGRHVVRLKSGDSGVFGRLEEELTALREAGIVVPPGRIQVPARRIGQLAGLQGELAGHDRGQRIVLRLDGTRGRGGQRHGCQGHQRQHRQTGTNHFGHETHVGRKMAALMSQQLTAST